MFIVYSLDSEVIITTPENEETTIAEYFGEDVGRSLDDADRKVIDTPDFMVEFSPRVWVG